MSVLEGGGASHPRVPLGFNLEQATELDRGDAIYHLQRNYHTLSQEVAHMFTNLREVLAYLRGDPGGGHRRASRNASPTPYSSSSQEEIWPRRERRKSRQHDDDLRDMRIDPPEFEGSLSPYLFIEWIQALERFFEIKEYSNEKAFKVVVLKLRSYASLWYENLKKQRN